jgi:hypothetical protein
MTWQAIGRKGNGMAGAVYLHANTHLLQGTTNIYRTDKQSHGW